MRSVTLFGCVLGPCLLAAIATSSACSDDATSTKNPTTATSGTAGASSSSGSTTTGFAGSIITTATSTTATSTTASTGIGGAGGSGGTGGAGTGGTGSGGKGNGGSGNGGTGNGGAGNGGTGTAGAGTGGTGTAGAGGAGMGGSSGAVDSGLPSVCDGNGTRILTVARVDDFEDASLSPGWATFNDVMPTPNSFMMLQAAGGALGTGHFGHYAGTGAKTTVMGGYGVGAIYNMVIDKVAGIYCLDISAFDGVTFWAKAATAGSRVSLNFVVPETNAKQDGGDCVSSCYSHPSKSIALTTEWAQFSIAFAEATGGTATVRNRLQLLGWLSPDSNWDFSIDEIQLYKGTPPTGPIRGGEAGP